MEMTERDTARFWQKVADPNDRGCRLWMAGLATGGYGQFKVGGRSRMAHVVSWVIENGSVPIGTCVLHRCDVRRCVEPSHLFLGTKSDNSADMVAKGRQASGERSGRYTKPERTARGDCHGMRLHPDRVSRADKNGNARLTWEKARAIRAIWDDGKGGRSQESISHEFSIDQTTVSRVILRKTWRE